MSPPDTEDSARIEALEMLLSDAEIERDTAVAAHKDAAGKLEALRERVAALRTSAAGWHGDAAEALDRVLMFLEAPAPTGAELLDLSDEFDPDGEALPATATPESNGRCEAFCSHCDKHREHIEALSCATCGMLRYPWGVGAEEHDHGKMSEALAIARTSGQASGFVPWPWILSALEYLSWLRGREPNDGSRCIVRVGADGHLRWHGDLPPTVAQWETIEGHDLAEHHGCGLVAFRYDDDGEERWSAHVDPGSGGYTHWEMTGLPSEREAKAEAEGLAECLRGREPAGLDVIAAGLRDLELDVPEGATSTMLMDVVRREIEGQRGSAERLVKILGGDASLVHSSVEGSELRRTAEAERDAALAKLRALENDERLANLERGAS